MNAPLYKFGLFGDPMSLVIAFVIGLGFGFFLEQAGFGSAIKLTKQFYLRDLAVLKVMFTAIVTAMLGTFLLSSAGLLDLSLVYLQPTYIWANIAGGLLLGFGFLIGGYCPGTSIASFATGRLDALFFIFGVFGGVFVFGEMWPLMADFAHAASMGKVTLPQLLGVPYGVVVLAVVLMAVSAFAAGEFAEVRFGGVDRASQLLIGSGSFRNSSRLLMGAFVLAGIVAVIVGDPYRGPRVTLQEDELALLVQNEEDHVTVDDLATWAVEGRADYRLIDLRDAEAFEKQHIPGAENIPLAELPTADLTPQDRFILYSQGQTHAAQMSLLLRARGYKQVYSVLGGMDEWEDRILDPRFPAKPAPEEMAEIERRKALSLHFGGHPVLVSDEGQADVVPVAAPVPTSAPAPAAQVPKGSAPPAAAPKKKKKEGC